MCWWSLQKADWRPNCWVHTAVSIAFTLTCVWGREDTATLTEHDWWAEIQLLGVTQTPTEESFTTIWREIVQRWQAVDTVEGAAWAQGLIHPIHQHVLWREPFIRNFTAQMSLHFCSLKTHTNIQMVLAEAFEISIFRRRNFSKSPQQNLWLNSAYYPTFRLVFLILLDVMALDCINSSVNTASPLLRLKTPTFEWSSAGVPAGVLGVKINLHSSEILLRPPWAAHAEAQLRGRVSPYISSVLWISAIRRSSFSECLGKNWNLEQ